MTYIGETLQPEAGEHGKMGHNAPPLDQMIVEQFEDGIDAVPNLRTRLNELARKADGLPDCQDDETAAKLGEFIKMCGVAADKVDEIRSTIKKPYLEAQRALDAKGKVYAESMDRARVKARNILNPYVQEQARLKRERDAEAAQQRAEEERLRREREAALAPEADEIEKAVKQVEDTYGGRRFTPAAPRSAPIARSDTGVSVSTRTVWKHEIVDMKKLPKDILQHPKVLEALSSVIGQRVKGGERDIKGVRIWSDDEAVVR